MRIKAQDESDTSGNEETDVAIPVVKPTQSRQEIARVAGISSNAVLQIEKFSVQQRRNWFRLCAMALFPSALRLPSRHCQAMSKLPQSPGT
jgi:hypothetical protein